MFVGLKMIKIKLSKKLAFRKPSRPSAKPSVIRMSTKTQIISKSVSTVNFRQSSYFSKRSSIVSELDGVNFDEYFK